MSHVDAAVARAEAFWFRRGPMVMVATAAVVNVVVLFDVVPGWTAPRAAKLGLLAFDASLLVGYAPAKWVVEKLWTPDLRRVLAVDSGNNALAGWEMTPGDFEEVEITDGHLHQWEALYPTFEALSFDDEELLAESTWKGTATDLQLLEYETKVDEKNGELSARAEWGTTLRLRLLGFVRAGVADELESFTELFEDATLPDGDSIKRAVEDAKPERLKDDRGRSKEVDETKTDDSDDDGPAAASPDRDGEAAPDAGPEEVTADD